MLELRASTPSSGNVTGDLLPGCGQQHAHYPSPTDSIQTPTHTRTNPPASRKAAVVNVMSVRPSGPGSGSGSGPTTRHPDVLSTDQTQVMDLNPGVHWLQFVATPVCVWLGAGLVWLQKEKLISTSGFPEANSLVSANEDETSGVSAFQNKSLLLFLLPAGLVLGGLHKQN